MFFTHYYNGSGVEPNSENVVANRCGDGYEDEPILYCPVCSRRLAERRCKLVCERCGYYMSCGDYY